VTTRVVVMRKHYIHRYMVKNIKKTSYKRVQRFVGGCISFLIVDLKNKGKKAGRKVGVSKT